MLQSEFIERTKVQVTGEEYADIEFLYMNVEMDKDEFCKWWLKNRNNKLFQDISNAYIKDMKRKNEDVDRLYTENQNLKAQLDEQKKFYEGSIQKGSEMWANTMKEFAKRIVRANEENEMRVSEVVEEEYSLDFIIKTKHEAGIPLSEEEINYMVGKL